MNPVLRTLQSFVGAADRPYDQGLSRWLGGVFREVEEGQLVMDFLVRSEMANPVGLLHGGIQNAILDDVIGIAVLTLGHEHFFLSLGLNVDYLNKAGVGETVTARARVLRNGPRIVNAECELLNGKGAVICRGSSNLMRSRLRVMPELWHHDTSGEELSEALPAREALG
jgi:acyl-coenzyme A thioesterase 13